MTNLLRKLLNQLVRSSRAAAPEPSTTAAAKDEADRLIAEGDQSETEGNLREACERYRKAVDVAPGYAKAQLNLGVGLEAVGDADGAIESYEAALAIDPRRLSDWLTPSPRRPPAISYCSVPGCSCLACARSALPPAVSPFFCFATPRL